jgi:predicted deacylase
MDSGKLIESFVFDSGKPGPALLVVGAVHGDGVAGTIALDEIIDEIKSGQLTIRAGKLIAVPVANRRAYDLGQRNAGESLNRICERHEHPYSHEEAVANELLSLIDDCDKLIDIHSCHPLDKPFVFMDHDTPQNRALAAGTGLDYVCTGWNELYERIGLAAPGPADYAHSKGKAAAVIECGWHADPAAVDVARRCIRNSLQNAGMIDGPAEDLSRKKLQNICFGDVVILNGEGSLVKAWKHLDRMHKGELIASCTDGRKVTAPYDGYILFPFADAKTDDEWFYLGREGRTLEIG